MFLTVDIPDTSRDRLVAVADAYGMPVPALVLDMVSRTLALYEAVLDLSPAPAPDCPACNEPADLGHVVGCVYAPR